MGAEEYVVERCKKLETEVERLETVVKMMGEDLRSAEMRCENFSRFVEIIQKHLEVGKYSVSIEMKKYIKEDMDDIKKIEVFLDFPLEKDDLGDEKHGETTVL